MTRQAKFFEDESITWKGIVEEKSQRLRELEEENDTLKSRKVFEGPAATDPTSDNDWKVVRDELTRQASYLRNLESSNARMTGELDQLRQRNKNIEVLEEQKRDLERKLENTDSLRQSVARLEAEVEAARKEREEWCANSRLLARPMLIPTHPGRPRPTHPSFPPALLHRSPAVSPAYGSSMGVYWRSLGPSKPFCGRRSGRYLI